MDFKGTEGVDEVKARSFRYEDYNTRRAFLRSYPLFYEAEEKQEEEETKKESAANGNGSNSRKHMKKIILAVFHWGGESALIFRRFKHKVTLYVITCLPVGLKAPTHLISV